MYFCLLIRVYPFLQSYLEFLTNITPLWFLLFLSWISHSIHAFCFNSPLYMYGSALYMLPQVCKCEVFLAAPSSNMYSQIKNTNMIIKNYHCFRKPLTKPHLILYYLYHPFTFVTGKIPYLVLSCFVYLVLLLTKCMFIFFQSTHDKIPVDLLRFFCCCIH